MYLLIGSQSLIITGRAGNAILAEFASRGTAVIAVARDPTKIVTTSNVTAVRGDVDSDDFVPILTGAKTVVCVVGSPIDPSNPYGMCSDEGGAKWVLWMKRIIQACKDARVGRFIMMGGAG